MCLGDVSDYNEGGLRMGKYNDDNLVYENDPNAGAVPMLANTTYRLPHNHYITLKSTSPDNSKEQKRLLFAIDQIEEITMAHTEGHKRQPHHFRYDERLNEIIYFA